MSKARILIKIKNNYYSILKVSKRNKEGGFVISGFYPKPKDYHISFVSNGKHHFSVKKKNIELLLFDDTLVTKHEGKVVEKIPNVGEIDELTGLERNSRLFKFFVPKQLTLFQIINGKEWSFEINTFHTDSEFITSTYPIVNHLKKGDYTVEKGGNCKLLLTMKKKSGDLIFDDLPYLYLIKGNK